MTNSLVETLIGALVLGVAAVFIVFAYTSAGMTRSDGYDVYAIFNRVDGITTGTDVRVAGIKKGTVKSLKLDNERYQARVELNIDSDLQLPDDSQIKVASEGLLGGSYLSIEPGGSEIYLKPGEEIQFTQGTVDFMSLISRALFSSATSSKPAENEPAAPEGNAPALGTSP